MEELKESLIRGEWDKYQFSEISNQLKDWELGECIWKNLLSADDKVKAFEQIKKTIPFSNFVTLVWAYYDKDYDKDEDFKGYNFKLLANIFSKEEFKAFFRS